PFLFEVCDTVINENAGAYPELAEKREYIKKIIGVEEEAFAKTIDKGTELLSQFIDKLISENGKTLSGDDAFKLADTYGFPIDLTIEICEEKGLSVDVDRFRELALEQRNKAKADHLAKAGSSWADNSIKIDAPKTVFTGYTDYTAENAEILAIYRDGQEINTAVEGDDVVILLDRTPFYAESGGQVGDTGVISNGINKADIADTIKSEGHFLHIASISEGSLSKGDKVTASINKERRWNIMRNHTSAHLLQNALRQVLGEHVHQAGQLVNDKTCRFDFNHFSAMTDEEISKVENIVNTEIMNNIPVTMQEMPIDEARKLGAMALFGEKYGDTVRVVTAGDSIEFCGGTHVSNTSQIGLFKIVSESSVAAGTRRIEAVTGINVLELLNDFKSTIIKSAKALKLANITELPEKCAAVTAELKEKDKNLESLNQQIANAKAADIFKNSTEINGISVIKADLGTSTPDELRKLGDSIKDKAEPVIALFAGVNGTKGTLYCVCSKEAVKMGANAGKLVREAAAVTGGKGGGKPDSAMAGMGDISKAGEAVNAFENIVAELIK
ncbi:MAG: alanine--tRNA ligase, partial [Ruminococcus sp.]|nr:alanine--tRNA ligase [Ruminococcus sp.]